MVKTENLALIVFGAFFVFSMLMILQIRVTGFATTGSTVSNVTISSYLSISMSGNLSQGVLFGTISTLPATNQNSTNNNNSAGSTSMFINVSSDSNTAVDVCIKSNAHLTDSTNMNTLGIGNESYANSTTLSATVPEIAREISLTTAYVKAGTSVAAGGADYYRFYLDVPVAQATGTYNNTINFEGVAAGQSCS